MKEPCWMELLEEAPVAVQSCVLYFQERYPGSWQAKLLDSDAILRYLDSKDFEITVATFGIPNRQDWFCEVIFQGTLLKHERNFATYELAADEAIITAFRKLETTLSS
ncbi:MAG: hypothetical protein KDD15_29100 [Lewinella sp.]|nr:hypothetical protein [Lewinella sp.]